MAPEIIGGASYIDSHAHLADQAFDSDRDDVVARARESGAEAIVCIGSGSGAGDVLGAARASRLIAMRHPRFVWHSAGIHPHDAIGFDSSRHIDELRHEIHEGAIAIGECGLDYHYHNSPRSEQRAAFAAQLELAAETRLPAIVHTRDAEADTQAMILDAARAGTVGVLHCYTGSHGFAEAAIDAGWYISFSGIVTFNKWTDGDLLRLVPEDRVLAESDAPYLAPVPNRGKRNEPAFVSHTVARLAAARGVTARAFGVTSAANARRLFGLAAREC